MKPFLLAVVALTLCVGCGGVDKTKLAAVYRSGKAVEASTSVGVTYPQFTALLQQLNTELLIARASNDAERSMLTHYTDAVAAYQDSATWWALKIRGGSLSDGPAKDLATKYALRHDYTADEGLQAIWITAGVALAQGNLSYDGGLKP